MKYQFTSTLLSQILFYASAYEAAKYVISFTDEVTICESTDLNIYLYINDNTAAYKNTRKYFHQPVPPYTQIWATITHIWDLTLLPIWRFLFTFVLTTLYERLLVYPVSEK